jgi:hypothetical protein
MWQKLHWRERWLPDDKLNFKQGILKKSKLAQHAYEEGHRVIWDEVGILENKSNSRCMK